MPYVRRRYTRRPYSKRRKTFGRSKMSRRKYSRYGRRRASGVYYFKRKSSQVFDWIGGGPISTILSSGATTQSWANIAFRLQDVPNYSDWTNAFDAYRIRAVKVNLIPMGNVSLSSNGVTGMAGIPVGNYAVRCFSAFDPNQDGVGITGPNAVDQLREYQNSRWTPYNRIHKRYLKPKIEMTSYGTSSGVNLTGKQPWIQTADGGAAVHYGMPLAIDIANYPVGTPLYQIECTYYLQFCRPK